MHFNVIWYHEVVRSLRSICAITRTFKLCHAVSPLTSWAKASAPNSNRILISSRCWSLLSLRWTRTIWAVDGSSQQPRSDVQSRLISRWSCAVVGWEGHVSSSYRTSDPLKYKVSIQIWKMIRHDHLILWYLRSNSKRKCMNLYDVYILVSYHSGKFLLFEHVDCIYIYRIVVLRHAIQQLSGRWSSCQDVRVNSMLQQTSQAIRLPKTHSFVNWCQIRPTS